MSPLFSSRTPDMFRDRVDAGLRLAGALRPHLAETPPEDIVAAGLARGGVIVAAEVARHLDVRLEAIVVRKLGAPSQPELAIGAITASGERVLNEPLIADIGLNQGEVDRIVARAQAAGAALCEEIGAPPQVPGIAGKTVLLIDDGMATGATMRVAIHAVSGQGAGRVVVALPVVPASMVEPLRRLADDVVAVLTPSNLQAVGQWYERFFDTPSEDVRAVLEENRRRRAHA